MNWLEQFLVQSIRQNLCTRVVCTTCGAREFRDRLRNALANQLGESKPDAATYGLIEIARALANVQPDFADAFYTGTKFESAVRLIITDIWSALGDEEADRVIAPLLSDSWAADLLARMKHHHAQRIEAERRLLEYEDPEQVRARRGAKRKLKQAQHAERIARKQWRERNDQSHGPGGASN
jgi:hypothetical protein